MAELVIPFWGDKVFCRVSLCPFLPGPARAPPWHPALKTEAKHQRSPGKVIRSAAGPMRTGYAIFPLNQGILCTRVILGLTGRLSRRECPIRKDGTPWEVHRARPERLEVDRLFEAEQKYFNHCIRKVALQPLGETLRALHQVQTIKGASSRNRRRRQN